MESQIKITLETFELSSCPRYTALSYTWGPSGSLSDPQDQVFTQVASCFPMICEEQIILGTRNLRDAMQSIRYDLDSLNYGEVFSLNELEQLKKHHRDVCYFWIDAICIDQKSVSERNHQVQLMSQIYKRAHRTFVWLGKQDESTKEGVDAIWRMYQNMSNAHVEADRTGKKFEYNPVKLSPTERQACAAVLGRNWFSRFWIIQEALLSQEVVVLIGTRRTAFAAYEQVFKLFQLIPFPGPKTMHSDLKNYARLAVKTNDNVNMLVRMCICRNEIARGSLPSFMEMIDMSRNQDCFDPRDRIYSILGIVREFSDGRQTLIRADYEKSIEAVFLETTMLILNSRKDLAVLNLIRTNSNLQKSPTWFPDYQNLARPLVESLYKKKAEPWRLPHPSLPELSVTNTYLTVYGQRIDQVREIAALRKPENVSADNDEQAYGLVGVLSLLTRIRAEGGQRCDRIQSLGRVDLLWQTLMYNMYACFDQLVGWTETRLPNGVGLLLPQLIRAWLVTDSQLREIRNPGGDVAKIIGDLRFDVKKLSADLPHLEFILAKLIELEPENAMFLPKPLEFSEAFDFDLHGESGRHWFLLNLLTNSVRDHASLREKATKFGLNLPQVFTAMAKVDLGASTKSQDPILAKSFNWMFGFVHGLSNLDDTVLFRTCNHAFGMAKCQLRSDDEIWILDGAYAPACLRKSKNGNYCFLGEVYIHEIMDGEAVAACTEPVRVVLE